MSANLFTLGFTQKNARRFFDTLASARARVLVDIRLNNTSQMAGFTKRDDLAFFLERILGIGYRHEILLAPSQEILAAYRAAPDWARYERDFLALLKERQVTSRLAPVDFREACLLCSEPRADHCHRRLAAEHLASAWGGLNIVHL